MNMFKPLLILGALATLSACGSSNPTTAPLAVNPYATNYGGNYGTQTGYGSTAIPGGSKTLTSVLTGTVNSYGTQVYSVSQNVVAGDQIIVNTNGSIMYAVGSILGGFGSTNSSGYLSGLKVSVSGYELGTSLNGTYNVPASGSLTLEGIATILNIAHTANTNYITTFTGGVYIAHCVNTAGAPMLCPAGY